VSRDAEDDDHTYFIHLEEHTTVDGEPIILSRAAFQLHGFGMVHSVQVGTPAFVSDDYLNAIRAETTIAAAELCAAGTWRRVEDGYEILDREMLDTAVQADRDFSERDEFCAATGGHEPDPEHPEICGKCLTPLDHSAG
jgi:hypothetical protein